MIRVSCACIRDGMERRGSFKHLKGAIQFSRDKTRDLGHKGRMLRISTGVLALFSLATALRADLVQDNRIIVSVRDQKLMLVRNGARVATYPVSTSKFGLGDNLGTMTTPLGVLEVAQKIGDHAPSGAVFHNRRWTGEVIPPNAPGRDPIVTRILWLRGLEPSNAHAFNRCIYIHGTPQEQMIGRPASYGCIRMRSSDVTDLYNQTALGTVVQIIPDRLPKVRKAPAAPATAPVPPVIANQTNTNMPHEAWSASAAVMKPAPAEKTVAATKSVAAVTLAALASAPTHLRSSPGN